VNGRTGGGEVVGPELYPLCFGGGRSGGGDGEGGEGGAGGNDSGVGWQHVASHGPW